MGQASGQGQGRLRKTSICKQTSLWLATVKKKLSENSNNNNNIQYNWIIEIV